MQRMAGTGFLSAEAVNSNEPYQEPFGHETGFVWVGQVLVQLLIPKEHLKPWSIELSIILRKC